MVNNYLAVAVRAAVECEETDAVYIHKASIIDNETDDKQLLLIEFSIQEEETDSTTVIDFTNYFKIAAGERTIDNELSYVLDKYKDKFCKIYDDKEQLHGCRSFVAYVKNMLAKEAKE